MTYKIYTLGCKVNSYESKVVSDILENNGYKQNDIADIYIVNTCTVTNTADNKSNKLLRKLKREHPNAIIIALGCMVQNKQNNLDEISADIVIGNQEKTNIIKYINNYKQKQIQAVFSMKKVLFENMQLNNFNQTRAFVKIQDGCNNFCSYCVIPYVRGNIRSKNKEKVLEEIQTLIQNGHKEIVLTGIHTGHYGAEFKNYSFAKLLQDIIQIKGLERLRISSIEATEINDEVINIIKKSDILVDHMHIPLQSGSDKILKLMNRKYDLKYFKNTIAQLRNIRPNISITTDVIVGFPGETENDFNDTIKTVKQINFSKIHVFPYSKRKGTKAETMPNQIDEYIKKQRVKQLIKESKILEINYMNKFLNKELVFIPEEYKEGYLIGHTGNYLKLKIKGNKNELHKDKQAKPNKIEYPYLVNTD